MDYIPHWKTVEKRKHSCKQDFNTFVQVLHFLDVSFILHQNGRIKTGIFYKETNSHEYLNYFSYHLEHTKQNIPHNLAKRTILFISDKAKMNERLWDLKTWLFSCSYSLAITDKAFSTLNFSDQCLKRRK